jgi:hypothetical protein
VRTSWRRWLVAGLVAAWASGLLALGIWSSHHDPATVRPQSGLSEGLQRLDRAVDTLRSAAGPGVEVEVAPYRTTTGCRVTLARRGTEVDATVLLAVPAGEEAVVLDRLVDRLPDGWGARYNPDTNRFFADAGDFVAVRGEVAQPGEVRLTATTGCRAEDREPRRGQ